MSSIGRWWERHHRAVVWAGVVVALLSAAVRVGHGVFRLTSPTDRRSGIDLRLRAWEVKTWFEGLPVYGKLESADYPPASYAMFWPFTGWMDVISAKWIWAILTILLLAALSALVWRAAKNFPLEQRLLLALLPASGYATHGLFVTGQVVAFALVSVTAGILILHRSQSLRADVLGSTLVILGLIKPTLTVPLIWIAFLVPGRLRPAALIVSGYAALTLFAASFQEPAIVELFRGWLGQGDRVNVGATFGNAQKLLAIAGLGDLFVPLALCAVLATGAWVYRYREIDVWILLGVTALVARLLTYHRSFDDLLIIFAVVALARIALSTEKGRRRVFVGMLAIAMWAGAMTPRVLLADVIAALILVNAVLPLLWMMALGLLVHEASRLRAFSRQSAVAQPVLSAA